MVIAHGEPYLTDQPPPPPLNRSIITNAMIPTIIAISNAATAPLMVTY